MESDYPNQLSETLQRYREASFLTVSELASQLGISKESLTDLERGATVPTVPTLRSMFRVLQWTLDDLGAVIMSLRNAPRRFYREPLRNG